MTVAGEGGGGGSRAPVVGGTSLLGFGSPIGSGVSAGVSETWVGVEGASPLCPVCVGVPGASGGLSPVGSCVVGGPELDSMDKWHGEVGRSVEWVSRGQREVGESIVVSLTATGEARGPGSEMGDLPGDVPSLSLASGKKSDRGGVLWDFMSGFNSGSVGGLLGCSCELLEKK